LIDPPSPHENDAALSTAMNDGYRLIPVRRQAADAGSSPALVSGMGGTSGVVLVEVFEVL
jgi:hypothetical protein